MEASPRPFKLRHSTAAPAAPQHRNRSKPSNSLCKFLIIVPLVLVIPLLPSQAHDFINASLFTKLWEPLQLLFVGLAVCYGLFSKRCTTNVEFESFSSNDKNEATDLYLSGILDMTSFFEDGFQNSCGYDEKRLILKSKEDYKLGEQDRVRSVTYENAAKIRDEFVGEKVTQGWNSQYFPGEALVVVANGDCVVDEWGEYNSKVKQKPLNLPVRSLRSKIVDAGGQEGSNNSHGAKGSFKIRGMRPINLEKKFEDVASPAPIPCKSRSVRMEMNEETRRPKRASRSRPHSAGEFDFEHLKLRSSRHLTRTNSKASSQREDSPSNIKVEDLERENDHKDPSQKDSMPRVASEASFEASKSLHLSIGSSAEMNRQISVKENLSEKGESPTEKSFDGRKGRINCLDKPILPPRVLSRGKSVRTFRSSKIVPDESSSVGDGNAGKMCDEIQDSSHLKGGGEGHENPPVDSSNPIIDDLFPLLIPSLPETQSEDKQDSLEISSMTSEEDTESKSDTFSSSSDEDVAGSDCDGSEVDRKAGEFIAKFKEQIRLQKLASIQRHRV